ncbi:MAG TPA: peroxiredoxin [Burkholderiaceae bacterium]|nr:peroxiredoxin [Burkholderiaceae bacterium]
MANFGLGGAQAALPLGATAPQFTTQAAMGGNEFTFSLADALKKGPVVLYFYPKAFTKGCTVEAHNFSEATDRFKSMGATVIGMSNDDIGTLKKFSVLECRNKFAVAADQGGQVMKQYDAVMPGRTDVADRISYVIAPDGKVIYAFASMSPDGHVENTLDAIQRWKATAHP